MRSYECVWLWFRTSGLDVICYVVTYLLWKSLINLNTPVSKRPIYRQPNALLSSTETVHKFTNHINWQRPLHAPRGNNHFGHHREGVAPWFLQCIFCSIITVANFVVFSKNILCCTWNRWVTSVLEKLQLLHKTLIWIVIF